MIERIQLSPAAALTQNAVSARNTVSAQGGFAQALESAVRDTRGVRFSAHATERLRERNLTVTAADEARIGKALDAAAAKGARETLLLTDRYGLVVSVPNRTVITAVPRTELADAVFTKIDSAMILASEPSNALTSL